MHRTFLSLAALALAATTGFLLAGPLNPPAGPITPTSKTLTDVEPRTTISAANTPGDADAIYKITQPGSYYLTGNITGGVGRHGIEIAASNVTLDLNGCALIGAPAMGAFDAVTISLPNMTNITVLNGIVRGWGGVGINLGGSGADNCRVDRVQASANTGTGIVAGSVAVVINCTSMQNGGSGFIASTGSTISLCSANLNGGNGFSIGASSTVSACSASLNTFAGFNVGNGSTLADCSALQNTSWGFSVGSGCSLSSCSAYNNDADGINAGLGASIHHCTAQSNAQSGINVASASIVTDCTTRSNTLDGIACFSQCQIRDNLCITNGIGDGAGIHAAGFDNRIEGNNCTGADRGIDLDASGNFIVRNSCSGNTTNWVMVANNYYGPIIDRAGVNTPLVNGSAAASTLVSTDPNANFTY